MKIEIFKWFFFGFVFFAASILKAQQGTVSNGASANNASGSISFSVGQLGVGNVSNGTGSMNQGIQQAYQVDLVQVDEHAIELNAKVYPNPSTDYLIIELVAQGTKRCQVLDGNGKVVELFDFTNVHTLDISKYANGTYFLTVVTESGNTVTHKFTKR